MTRQDKAIAASAGFILAGGAAAILAIPLMGTFLPLLGWGGAVGSIAAAAWLRENVLPAEKPNRRENES